MTQTIVAAAGLRRGVTRVASNTRSDVPAQPTPTPIARKARIASRIPPTGWVDIHAVAVAAATPPIANMAMPPTIQGVRRPPASEP